MDPTESFRELGEELAQKPRDMGRIREIIHALNDWETRGGFLSDAERLFPRAYSYWMGCSMDSYA